MKLDLEDIARRVLSLSISAGDPRALVGGHVYAFELAALAFAHMPACLMCKKKTGPPAVAPQCGAFAQWHTPGISIRILDN